MEIYFLIVLEIGKSKVKVLTNSFPGESSPSWTADGHLSLCPHMAFPRWVHRERERARSLFLFLWGHSSHQEGPTLMHSYKPNYTAQRPYLQTPSHSGGRASTYELGVGGGATNTQSITIPNIQLTISGIGAKESVYKSSQVVPMHSNV